MAQGFRKFMDKGDSGAKKKERIRQEKKKLRQETKEYFEKKKQEAREARAQGQAGGFQSERGRKDYGKQSGAGFSPKAGTGGNEAAKQRGNEQGYEKKATSFKPHAAGNKGIEAKRHKGAEKGSDATTQRGKEQGYEKKATSFKPQAAGNKSKRHKGIETGSEATRQRGNGHGYEKKATSFKPQGGKPQNQAPGNKIQAGKNKGQENKSEVSNSPSTGGGRGEAMPLNKFIAHAGVCSRRDAVELVKDGKVVVNGEKVMEPGYKVTDKDEVKVNGKKLFTRRNLVYILLNKPKDFITTTEDPQGRKTVLDIIRNATPERVYPIGRLDRNTTGVLLLTNDGELAQKLSHPSYEIKKIYEVKLDKPLVKKDFDAVLNGVTLEDGFVAPDSLAYADPKDKSVIGIEIHSGRNRIVRRIFEHLGYDVRNLDRVMYANLTKKNVDRGKWRFLTEKEVRLLKYLNASYTKNKNVARG
jgi:23S rRNA pseudouridine2605 synthase